MTLNPSRHRILLVGPRVVHLQAHFAERGYIVRGVPDGVAGMAVLSAEAHDLVVFELQLGEITATELLMAVRQSNPHTTFLLLDDKSKAGQIVKALQAGLDGYVATPPDAERLFFEVERHLRRTLDAANRDARARDEASQAEADNAARVVQAAALEEAHARAEALNQDVTALRSQLQSARRSQSDQQAHIQRVKEQLDEALIELAELKAKSGRTTQTVEGSALAEGLIPLERELAEARAELTAQKERHEAKQLALAEQVQGLLAEQARRKRERQERETTHATEVARLAEDHRLALDALRKEHNQALAALTRHAAEQRDQLQAQLAAAASAHASAVSAQEAALSAALAAALADRERAVEKALDSELVVEELEVRIQHLEQEVTQAQERVRQAEEQHRRDRLRLVEERERTAAGTADGFLKLERVISENAQLVARCADLEQQVLARDEDLAKVRAELDRRPLLTDPAAAHEDP